MGGRLPTVSDIALALQSEVVAVVGPGGSLVAVAPAAATVLGRNPEELVGGAPTDLVAEADRPRLESILADGRGRLRARAPDGGGRWLDVDVRPGAEAGAGAGEVVLVLRDASQLVDTERELSAAEARYRALTDDLPDVVFAADPDGLLTHLNPSFERQTGIAVADALGMHIIDLVQPDERLGAGASLDALQRGEVNVALFEGRYHSAFLGRMGWFEVVMRVVHDDAGLVIGTSGVIRDVTARKEAEVELAYRARHDGLTGLLNRAAVVDHLTVALAAATSGAVAVLFLDLDGFKQVNDRLGHEAGDALLADVGQRIRHALREGEVAGRVGGDEFVVVSKGHASPDVGFGVVERIHGALAGNEHEISASIGVAFGTGGTGLGVSDLLRSADEAMYRAKWRRSTRSPSLPADGEDQVSAAGRARVGGACGG